MLTRLLPFAVIFLGGWDLVLPVTDADVVPVWAAPLMPLPRIFLRELLFVLYLASEMVRGTVKRLSPCGPGRKMSSFVLALGMLGVISNLANLQPLREMGEAGRLLLMGLYVLALVRWADELGPAFVLRALLIGLCAGGAVNIYYSFRVRFMELAGLPWLLGQNGPGGFMGLSVVISAWLMGLAASRTDRVVALLALAVGVFATVISFSKLAILMALFGGVAWLAVLVSLGLARRTKRTIALIGAVTVLAIAFNPSVATGFGASALEFAKYKFNGGIVNAEKDLGRINYFYGVAEIVSVQPLFGVGYAGFYDEFIQTAAGRAGITEESPDAGRAGESNPHSAFLYYASANGLPGLLTTLGLFLWMVVVIGRAVVPLGTVGVVLWGATILAYLVNGLTLPTLFNTQVMYVLPAVSCAMVIARRRRKQAAALAGSAG